LSNVISARKLSAGDLLSWAPMAVICLVFGSGCVAWKGEMRDMQNDLQNSAATARKEQKAELEAAKKQAHDETQQAVQALRTEIDGKAIKALTDQKEKTDALSAEILQLRQQVQADHETMARAVIVLKAVQDQLTEVQKTNLQVLREFQELRKGVQITYGGVLDYLKVEEALLKSSLNRVQSILHGVNQSEAGALPAILDSRLGASPVVPASPPAASQEAPPLKAAP